MIQFMSEYEKLRRALPFGPILSAAPPTPCTSRNRPSRILFEISATAARLSFFVVVVVVSVVVVDVDIVTDVVVVIVSGLSFVCLLRT